MNERYWDGGDYPHLSTADIARLANAAKRYGDKFEVPNPQDQPAGIKPHYYIHKLGRDELQVVQRLADEQETDPGARVVEVTIDYSERWVTELGSDALEAHVAVTILREMGHPDPELIVYKKSAYYLPLQDEHVPHVVETFLDYQGEPLQFVDDTREEMTDQEVNETLRSQMRNLTRNDIELLGALI